MALPAMAARSHGGVTAETGGTRSETDAVPDGRFALLRTTGFTLAIRFAPLPG